MMERKAFLAKPKHQNHVFQWEKCVYVPNHKENRDYYEYPWFNGWMLILRKMGERKAFSAKQKSQNYVS